MSRRRISKAMAKKIARERMDILLGLAEIEMREGRATYSRKYVELAARIGMRYNTPMGKQKRSYCSKCRSYFVFPTNASVRLKNGRIVITCAECGTVSRYPFKR